MKKNILKKILKTNQTVFSFKELLLLLQPIDKDSLKSKLHYYIKRGDLYHIRRGLYAKDMHYDHFELATKIFIPSYISFETVLASAGMIFQYYSQIFVASYQSREVMCDQQAYIYRRLKKTMLTNPAGIKLGQHYSIATKERAFLDTIYINKRYHFDNLSPLDWDLVFHILSSYEHKKTMQEKVNTYYNLYKKEL